MWFAIAPPAGSRSTETAPDCTSPPLWAAAADPQSAAPPSAAAAAPAGGTGGTAGPAHTQHKSHTHQGRCIASTVL